MHHIEIHEAPLRSGYLSAPSIHIHGSVGGACSAWSTHMPIALAISHKHVRKSWCFAPQLSHTNAFSCEMSAENGRIVYENGGDPWRLLRRLNWCDAAQCKLWQCDVWCDVWIDQVWYLVWMRHDETSYVIRLIRLPELDMSMSTQLVLIRLNYRQVKTCHLWCVIP